MDKKLKPGDLLREELESLKEQMQKPNLSADLLDFFSRLHDQFSKSLAKIEKTKERKNEIHYGKE